MPNLTSLYACLFLLLACRTEVVHGQPIAGSSLSHRSGGVVNGSSLRLQENGYAGAYFKLDEARHVTIDVTASGLTADSVPSKLGIAVADKLIEFEVAETPQQYAAAYDLPAGTYFVRAQLGNAASDTGRSLDIDALNIQNASAVSNVALSNRAVNEANALAAADTYIEHFRKGETTLAIAGSMRGEAVQVRMLRNEFNFGAYVTGFSANAWVGSLSPGETSSDRARFQDFVSHYFNMLVPSNMGKWQPTENTEGVPSMGNVDAIIGFADRNNMAFRQHNLAWGHQQPAWVNSLIDGALNGDEQSKAGLRQAIIERIRYYVGDGDDDTNDGDRAQSYRELDVVNEMLREKTYYNIFGIDGLSEIYRLAKDAVDAAGADTLLMTNEYNVFNFAGDPLTGESDNYANWYREHVEALNSAGYGQVVTGIGIQAQTNPAPDDSHVAGQNHSPARMNQVLQNLAITGLPVTLTEFSVPSEAFGYATSPQRAAEVYDETLRMMYGSPLAESMLIWEEWPPNATDQTTIVDSNWNLTPAGEAFVALMEQWRTPDQLLAVRADGSVLIEGYYGQYEVIHDGKTYVIDLRKDLPVQALVAESFLPGDYNRDHVVDASDYAVWRSEFHKEGLVPYAGADGNGDRVVDFSDYAVWRAHYGETGPFSFAPYGLVPEPYAWMMLSFSIVAGVLNRWTRSGLYGTSPLGLSGGPR